MMNRRLSAPSEMKQARTSKIFCHKGFTICTGDKVFILQQKETLTWSQRIAATVGIAKGIQFLHTGIVPGVFALKLKTTDILLDLNFVAKISSHNLPMLTEYIGKIQIKMFKNLEKFDIYDLGVIFLELMVGKRTNNNNEVDNARLMLEASTTSDIAAWNSMVDPTVQDSYFDESLKTVMQICCRCLLEDDRPSIEDVLWNLQFAAQVQDLSQSTEGSPTFAECADQFKELWLFPEGDSNHIGSSHSVFLVLLDTPSNSHDEKVKVLFTLRLKDWISKIHLQKTDTLWFSFGASTSNVWGRDSFI